MAAQNEALAHWRFTNSGTCPHAATLVAGQVPGAERWAVDGSALTCKVLVHPVRVRSVATADDASEVGRERRRCFRSLRSAAPSREELKEGLLAHGGQWLLQRQVRALNLRDAAVRTIMYLVVAAGWLGRNAKSLRRDGGCTSGPR
jgi:hypothetical protein